MRKTKSFPLFAAVVAATAPAATVSAAPAAAKSTQGGRRHQLSKTLDIGMLAPLTGAPASSGRSSLVGEVRRQDAARDHGAEGQARARRHPGREGPGGRAGGRQKFIADKNMVAVVGGSTSGSVVSTSKALTQAGIVQVRVGDAHDAHEGRQPAATNAFFRVVRPMTSRARRTPTTCQHAARSRTS